MLTEKLPESEKMLILDWIKEYGISHRDHNVFPFDRMAPLNRILRAWDEGKQEHLWKMFGEQFILEREVSYQRPDDVLCQQINNALSDSAMKTFRDKLYENVEVYFAYYSNEYTTIRHLFDTDALKENRWSRNSFTIQFSEMTLDIPRGAKVMKVLNKLAKYFHIETEFEKFRIEHSQILNQKLLQGTLCLSIHPFDYMTMSDNTYDWDSCMNWESAECYRTGTIEMMNSPYMVVAYLKGDKSFRMGSHFWDGNKKWRELFVVHPHAICNIKPYPYMNKVISEMALEWLRELAAQNLGWDVSYDAMEFSNDETFKYFDKRYYRFCFYTNYMYNDFNTCNTCHMIIVPQDDYKDYDGEDDDTIYEEINISGRNICACCASEWDPDEGHEDQVLCFNCDSGPHCDSCGEQEDEDDMYYVEGDWLCSCCYDEEAGKCVISEDYFYNDNLITVYLAPVDNNLDHMYLLYSCRVHKNYAETNALRHENQFNINSFRTAIINGELVYYVNMDDCKSYCLEEAFGLWSSWAKDFYIERYKEAITQSKT